jgi:hypothetical protein
MRTTQQILADLRKSIDSLAGTRVISSWAKQDIINGHITLINELETLLANVKTTIEKAEKPAKVETVVEAPVEVVEATETVKAKATTAKK